MCLLLCTFHMFIHKYIFIIQQRNHKTSKNISLSQDIFVNPTSNLYKQLSQKNQTCKQIVVNKDATRSLLQRTLRFSRITLYTGKPKRRKTTRNQIKRTTAFFSFQCTSKHCIMCPNQLDVFFSILALNLQLLHQS